MEIWRVVPAVVHGPIRHLDLPHSRGRPGPAVTVRRIISGGQTGADRGGLDAAIARGIEHGGWCPAGRRAEDGRIPARYGRMLETPSRGWGQRTRANVVDSDATIVVVRHDLTPGSRLTVDLCKEHGMTYLVVAISEMSAVRAAAGRVREWLAHHKPRVLNVAGSRESKAPGIQLDTAALVELALTGRPHSPENDKPRSA